MKLKTAQEICKQYKSSAVISGSIDKDGEIIISRINFFHINKKEITDAIKTFKLGKLIKVPRFGDIDLQGDNFFFNQFDQCKIVRYETKHIPARTERIPVYDCDENNKTKTKQ